MPQAALLKDLDSDSELIALITAAPMPPVTAGSVDRATAQRLEDWLEQHAATPPACQAGLWLLAGDLDKSHALSQDLPSADGSFWHGIMHRREGDFANSKYWMRRVGNHPVIAELATMFPEYSDPFRFVDRCQAAARQGNLGGQEPSAIQWAEWQLLFAHCWQAG